MKFNNEPCLKIHFYPITITDEKFLDFDRNFDFVLNFIEILNKIKLNPFKTQILNEFNDEINAVLEQMEKLYPQEKFEDTRERVLLEIIECKLVLIRFFIIFLIC